MNCDKCNSQISADSKFCIKCGEKISKNTTSGAVTNGKNISKFKKILYTIIALTVFVVTMVIVRYITQTVVSKAIDKTSQNNTYSTESLAYETVKEIKRSMQLPNQIDEFTKLVDITAEQKAIRYHYILTNIDSSQLTNDSLKNNLKTGVCSKEETKAVLNQGIDMEYSYIIADTQQSYFVTITKNDCLN